MASVTEKEELKAGQNSSANSKQDQRRSVLLKTPSLPNSRADTFSNQPDQHNYDAQTFTNNSDNSKQVEQDRKKTELHHTVVADYGSTAALRKSTSEADQPHLGNREKQSHVRAVGQGFESSAATSGERLAASKSFDAEHLSKVGVLKLCSFWKIKLKPHKIMRHCVLCVLWYFVCVTLNFEFNYVFQNQPQWICFGY